MNSEEHEKLREEQAKGSDAKRTFNKFIKPFIDEKRLVLFEAFQEISIQDVDKLLETKRQLMVVNALETEMQSIINTGKMAAKTLAIAEKQENKDDNSS